MKSNNANAPRSCAAHADSSADQPCAFVAQLPRARLLSLRDRLAPPLTLSEAQFLVAREAGCSSWPALKHALQESCGGRGAGRDAVLDAAIAGDHSQIDLTLARTPDLPQRSLHLAAALGWLADAVPALLAADPSLADHPGGRRGWPPLLYLCASRARRHPAVARLAIARQLIAAGARATGREPGFQSTHGTMLSPDHELLAIEAAAGGAADPAELVRLLLDAVRPRRDDRRAAAGRPRWEYRGPRAAAGTPASGPPVAGRLGASRGGCHGAARHGPDARGPCGTAG